MTNPNAAHMEEKYEYLKENLDHQSYIECQSLDLVSVVFLGIYFFFSRFPQTSNVHKVCKVIFSIYIYLPHFIYSLIHVLTITFFSKEHIVLLCQLHW